LRRRWSMLSRLPYLGVVFELARVAEKMGVADQCWRDWYGDEIPPETNERRPY
jgi:hypothetical protein